MAGLPIHTHSLLLRRLRPEDAAAVLALALEAASRTWLPSQVPRDRAHADSIVASLIAAYASPGDPRLGPYVLAVEHRADRALIGHVGFSPLEGDVEIGFAIGEAHQGRGLAAEAVAAASEWAFRTFGLDRILGVTAATNTASKRTLERAGFVHQRDALMNFQSTEQSVSVYALSV